MKLATDMMDRIDALSVRERAAIFIAVLAVVFFIWDGYLMNSLNDRERTLKTRLQQSQAEQATLNAELQVLIRNRQEDPNAANRKRLAALRAQLEQVQSEVLASTRHLISPGRMATLLENVLARTEGLELVEVRNIGVSPLVKAEAGKGGQSGGGTSSAREGGAGADKGAIANAYKHGLKIVFKGGYLATLEYIRRLEELDDEFIWDALEYKITEYPDGRAAVTVYTLSLDKHWIGV